MLTAARVRTFKDLVVWQKAMELSVQIYHLTKKYPSDERYGLTAETRKTARSIPYNIAEGHKRPTTADYIRFLGIAAGSVGKFCPSRARAPCGSGKNARFNDA